ncbi:MAG: hypothetical protein KBB55_00250 [Candidatus Buchananbacteria bacterium]|nr:hypothetical protein [Candidatus Buchananbacteria bacterium]
MLLKTASAFIDRGAIRRYLPILVIGGVLLCAVSLLATPTLTQAALDTKALEATKLGSTFGGSNITPMEAIGNIIKFFLGFLAVVAVLLIMYGGWKWMTAGGESKNVGEAKDIIKNAVIGLVLVLISYAIATSVINIINQRLLNAAGSSGQSVQVPSGN